MEVVAEHLHKESRVFLNGKLRTRSWQDDTGQQRYVAELHADTAEFLDGRRD
jgi:single-strand DNA-binding protein